MVEKRKNNNSSLEFTLDDENQLAIKKRLSDSGTTVISTPDWVPKISEVFIDFISPYEDFLEVPLERKLHVFLGVTAWNIATSPKKHHKKQIHEVIDSLREMLPKADPDMAEGLKEMRDILRNLIDRKLKYFADDHRYIMDYQVSEDEDEFHIAIAATLPK